MVTRKTLKAFTKVLFYLHHLRYQPRGPFRLVHVSKICLVMKVNYDSGLEVVEALYGMKVLNEQMGDNDHIRLNKNYEGSSLKTFITDPIVLRRYDLEGFDTSLIVPTLVIDEENEWQEFVDDIINPALSVSDLSEEEQEIFYSGQRDSEEYKELMRKLRAEYDKHLHQINKDAED